MLWRPCPKSGENSADFAHRRFLVEDFSPKIFAKLLRGKLLPSSPMKIVRWKRLPNFKLSLVGFLSSSRSSRQRLSQYVLTHRTVSQYRLMAGWRADKKSPRRELEKRVFLKRPCLLVPPIVFSPTTVDWNTVEFTVCWPGSFDWERLKAMQLKKGKKMILWSRFAICEAEFHVRISYDSYFDSLTVSYSVISSESTTFSIGVLQNTRIIVSQVDLWVRKSRHSSVLS